MFRSVLKLGESLKRGERLESPDKSTWLVFQDDNNLCLYDRRRYLWGSGTNGQRGNALYLERGGDLVIYTEERDEKGNYVTVEAGPWRSLTNGIYNGPDLSLRCQDDGNLVLRGDNTDALWKTDTDHTPHFRRVEFTNWSDAMMINVYPCVTDESGQNKIWSGRWDTGFYWRVPHLESKTVDFGKDTDRDGNRICDRLRGQKVKFGFDVVAGLGDPVQQEAAAIYDEGTGDVINVTKYGGLESYVRTNI
ncbi:MAG: hypothetical protein M1828_002793 [Chrysothrix sp. TS-e1954]|nr:MAG: hypothetical protein M1828_002793 [Chrysothrix sp. TS-e1954]